MSEKNIKILGITGLPGSGKSEAVKYLTEKNYPKVYFGGVVLDSMASEGIEHTHDNEQAYREKIRNEGGSDFIVNKIIEQIHGLINAGQHRIVADGIYSWTEYKRLKHEFPGELIVIAITAPKHLRHHRLSNRDVRPLNQEEANRRDWDEIEKLDKGGTIAIADYFIANDSTLDKFHQQIDEVCEEINFYN